MNKTSAGMCLAALAFLCAGAQAATQFSSADYYLYPADFNNDGKSDLLYIAKTPDKPSGIALADSSGNPQIGFQSWPANYLNIPWSSGLYTAVVADFNGDHYADILLQRSSSGTQYLLLANSDANVGPVGQILGISQGIDPNGFGLAWSSDQHRLIPGDFDGNGKADLFFQSTVAGGTNAIVLSSSNGTFDYAGGGTANCGGGYGGHGPWQCWTDGYKGFNWSTKASNVYAANFGGDSKWDLLVQAKPAFVMIDYDVPFPVPTFKPQSFGILLAQADNGSGIFRTLDDVWSWNERGINWSPLNTNLIIGDFNGDGKADIFAQARGPGGTNKLLLENASGTGQVQSAISVASNVAGYTGNAYTLTSGYFGGSSVAVLYAQATTASGSNFYTGNISAGGGSTFSSGLQIAPSLPSPATVVGATPGSASVSASGSAQYSIPLQFPRGTAGLTPELSLSYGQGTQNGLLGMGWGIGGLSIITRCPKTIAQDGVTQGVQLASTDQYCLDGNRLRLTSGTQGADLSQYRTELETYSLITAKQNGTNGPVWFEVKMKNGLIYEYGNSTDSRVAVPGVSTTRVWALSKIRDRASNYITFSYFNNNLNASCTETVVQGSYHPCQIQYTGNSDNVVSPEYTLQFVYEARNSGENLVHYYGGGLIQELKRLKRIELKYAGAVVKDYRLVYETPSSFSSVSRLSSIQECGAAGGCLSPSTFAWSSMQVSAGQPAVGAGVSDPLGPNPAGYMYPPQYGDFNGDGVMDRAQVLQLVTQEFPGLTVYWGARSGQSPPPPTTFSTSYFNGLDVADLDLDGKQDLLTLERVGTTNVPKWLHQLSNGTLAPDTVSANSMSSVLADVDGDGYQDKISTSLDNTHVYVQYHNRDGSAGYEATNNLAWTAPSGTTIMSSFMPWWVPDRTFRQTLTSADVDGDGRQDLLLQVQNGTPSNGGWLVLYSTGTGFATGDLIVSRSFGSVAGGDLKFDTPALIDVNGDGCTDFLYPVSGTGVNWKLATSQCAFISGIGLKAAVSTTISTTNVLKGVIDLNQDGYQDFVYAVIGPPPNYGSTLYVAFSTGLTVTAGVLSSSSQFATWVADLDGDGLPEKSDSCLSPCTPTGWFNYPSLGPKPDLLLSAKDGFGNQAKFTYAPLTDPSVYTRGSGWTGANQDFQSAMYVVKQVQSTDGAGGTFATGYSYESARRNVQGRGLLGFAKRIVTDSRTDMVTEETYNQSITTDGSNWEKTGRLAETKVRQTAAGAVIQDTVYTWSSIDPAVSPEPTGKRRYPYVSTKTVTKYELSGTQIGTETSTTTIDTYGTPYNVVTTSVENATGINPSSSFTQQTYIPTANITNDTTNWCLSRPTQIQSIRSHTLTNGGSITRTTNQTWDVVKCRITDQVVEPGANQLTTHIDYDGFNNVWKTTLSGAHISPSRTTENHFLTSGRLQDWVKNPLLQKTSFTWDSAKGVKLTETDPNLRVTTITYDTNFDHVTRVLRPDGTSTRFSYFSCDSTNAYCGDGLLRFMVESDERNIADTATVTYKRSYSDGLGRPKYEQQLGFSGALSIVQTMYDSRGNVASTSMPYFSGTDPYKGSSYTYDLLSRVTQVQRPISDGNPALQTETTVYNGFTTTHFDANGGSRTQVSNARGEVVRVVDEGSQNTDYTYSAFGELRTTTDPASNVTTLTYNNRGFKDTSTDPDMGLWTYTYDEVGAPLTHTDAKLQVTSFEYDALGRTKKRTDAPGGAANETNWTWDIATNGVGQLASVTSPGSYSENYAYDVKGRRSTFTTVAAGTSYAIDYAYDAALGTLQTLTYPASIGASRFQVQYSYQNGYLKDVRDASSSALLWQTLATDARGHVIDESYGNGQRTYLSFDETNGRLNYLQTGPTSGSATQNLNYQWDKVGNLLSRQDANQSVSESFGYDALNRLTTVQRNGSSTLTMAYDANGNVTSRSDVGATDHTYNYTTAQAGCTYTGLPAQPHAVRKAGGAVYCYDKNGNMTSRNGASVTWTTFNYPQTINQAGGNYSAFYYGADRSRYRQTSQTGVTVEERIYIGGMFEKSTVGAVTEYRHHVTANGKIVVIHKRASGGNENYYVHEDHLGSTDVITKQDNSVVVRLSYDAWGARRGSAWTGAPSGPDVTAINASTHRGYTGEEQLDNLNLVHLNGRIFDPTLGRFMSADPIVQDPFHSQSYNRYSYVWNNPLNATDPTGFCTGSRIASFCDSYYPEQSGQWPGTTMSFGQSVAAMARQATDAILLSAQMTSGMSSVGTSPSATADVVVSANRVDGGLQRVALLPEIPPEWVADAQKMGRIAHLLFPMALAMSNPDLAGRIDAEVKLGKDGVADLTLEDGVLVDNIFVYELKPRSWQFGSDYRRALRQIGRYTSAPGRRPGAWRQLEIGQPVLMAFAYVEIWKLAGNISIIYRYDARNPSSGLVFYEMSPMLRRNPDEDTKLISKLTVWPNPGNGR